MSPNYRQKFFSSEFSSSCSPVVMSQFILCHNFLLLKHFLLYLCSALDVEKYLVCVPCITFFYLSYFLLSRRRRHRANLEGDFSFFILYPCGCFKGQWSEKAENQKRICDKSKLLNSDERRIMS